MGLKWFRQGYENKYCIGRSPITKTKHRRYKTFYGCYRVVTATNDLTLGKTRWWELPQRCPLH